MSVEAMTAVLHHSRASGTDKLILIGIANHDGDGGAWPAVATLAKYANVSTRSVQRSLSALVELGEVRVIYRDGGTRSTRDDRRPNRYEVLVECPETCDRSKQHRPRGDVGVTPSGPSPRGDADVTPSRSRGDVLVSSGVTHTSPEPSYEPPGLPADLSTSSSPRSTRELADDDGVAQEVGPGAGPVVPQAAPGSEGELTEEQAHEITCAVIAIRPEWQTPGIRAQLRQVAHLPYDDVRSAFEEAAADRTVYTPMHLATAAQDRMVTVAGKEAAAQRRERDAESWREQVHEDAVNRARPEVRAQKIAEAREQWLAARMRRQEATAATQRPSDASETG